MINMKSSIPPLQTLTPTGEFESPVHLVAMPDVWLPCSQRLSCAASCVCLDGTTLRYVPRIRPGIHYTRWTVSYSCFLLLLLTFLLGFEYWSDPSDPTGGFITWQSAGQQSARLGATAVGPDTDPVTGSGVGQRLIPVEPMVCLSFKKIFIESLTWTFRLLFSIWVFRVCFWYYFIRHRNWIRYH